MTDKQPCCDECASPYAPRVAHQRFCSPACGKAFNNRRMTRGAEMYDYVMAGRYERATHASIWRETLTRMATLFRDMDAIERDGRKSWHTPDPLGDPRAVDISRRKRIERIKAA